MVIKKDLVIVILATFCLTLTLFTILPTGSNYKASSIGEYDPWSDYNDDGKIDIKDLVHTISLFQTYGEPINKTALLLELQARMDSLNASLLNSEAYLETRITTLNASVAAIESDVTTLQTTIAALESRIAALETPGFMKAPAYDSGWVSMVQGGDNKILWHNLGTVEVLVYVTGKDAEGMEIHQVFYGGEYTGYDVGTMKYYGMYWYQLTQNSISIVREKDDFVWDQVRVQIWIIQ